MRRKTAGYQRRADEWMLQYNLAAHELMQIGRQILTSLIAEQIAHHEYLTVKQQIANAQEVDRFLHEKFTNEDLYPWMQGEISRLYYEYYRFAFDTARKAEQTMKQELMRPELDAPGLRPVQLLGRRPQGPALRRGALPRRQADGDWPTTTTTSASSS